MNNRIKAAPLIRRANAKLARFYSRFNDGLHFLHDVMERQSRFFSLCFIPDFRFT